MRAQRIDGRVALVTGANRGLGRALTEALLARGARKVYAAPALARNGGAVITVGSTAGPRVPSRRRQARRCSASTQARSIPT